MICGPASQSFSLYLSLGFVCFKMSDIRKFLKGGRECEKRELTETEKAKKRRQDQKKYESKRKRSIQDSWLKEFSWAKEENEVLFCDLCRRFPELSDKESSLVKGITENYRKETLKFHEKI